MFKSITPLFLLALTLMICATLAITRAPGLQQAGARYSAGPSVGFSSHPSSSGVKCSYDGDFTNDAPGCK